MAKKPFDPDEPNEDDGSWDYRVVRWKGCRVLFGEHPPIGDLHALLRQWEISGAYRWVSYKLARRWGAVAVVCKSVADELALLEDPETPLRDCEDEDVARDEPGVEQAPAGVLPGERGEVEAADQGRG